MQFADFVEANDVLRAAPGTRHRVQDLPIFRQLPYVVSCIELDAQELGDVVATGQVFLLVEGELGCSAEAYTQALHRFSFLTDFAQVEQADPVLAEFVGANVDPMLFMQPLPGQKLPADSLPCGVACYQLNEEQVAQVSLTGRLYLKALGNSHAPISVYAANPITFSAPVEETEPPLTDLSNQSN